MKKRTFGHTGKSKVMKTDKRVALEQKVLAQMRETRESIDPKVLARFRDVIAQNQLVEDMPEAPLSRQDEVIDKRKTYETVLKFAKLRQDNQAFMNEIFKVLGTGPKH